LFSFTSLLVFSGIGIFGLAWTAAFKAGWEGRVGVCMVLLVQGVIALCVSLYSIDPEQFMLGLAQLGSQ